jgi:hypothetical protein
MTFHGFPLLALTAIAMMLSGFIGLAVGLSHRPPISGGIQERVSILFFSAMILFGIASMAIDAIDSTAKERAYTGVPPGAVIYEGSLKGNLGWKKWKLGNDCYLSRDLGTRSSVMTNITCPQ